MSEQPIIIMPKDTMRDTGKSAQIKNIQAAVLLSDTIRTTLGPKGMDKMIVDSLGDITITNDGATILKEMELNHPIAKMLLQIAKTQEHNIGDGTTTAVVIAGELLKQAQHLIDQNIHPTIIIKGFQLAKQHALIHLNKLSIESTPKQIDKILETTLTGKNSEQDKFHLSNLLTQSKKNIFITAKIGQPTSATKIFQGLIIDRHSTLITPLLNPKVCLLSTPFQIALPDVTTPLQIQQFAEQEETLIKQQIKILTDNKVNIIFCQKGVSVIAKHYLARANIEIINFVNESELLKLSKATKSTIISSIKDLQLQDIGQADKITYEDKMVQVKLSKSDYSTLIVCAPTEHVVSETIRALEDAIGVLKSIRKDNRIVGGAGAPELSTSREVQLFAESISGRERLAVEAYATALEIIPKTLIENAGLDLINMMSKLKSSKDDGINVFTGEVINPLKEGILEPLKIKIQALTSASDVAIMILRIDDVIVGAKRK